MRIKTEVKERRRECESETEVKDRFFYIFILINVASWATVSNKNLFFFSSFFLRCVIMNNIDLL